MKLSKKIFLCAAIFLAAHLQVDAQVLTASSKDAEDKISEESLLGDVAFLSGPFCKGRATGSGGGTAAAFYIADRFCEEGVIPFGENYFRNFKTNEAVGHNVLGMLKGNPYNGSDKFIIIAAHYDSLGELGGTTYPGADSNASGVASMLGIARMFSYMREGNRIYNQHIIFAALDGKQLSMAGAQALWDDIDAGRLISPVSGKPITRRNVTMFVNLDILGSTEAPIHKDRKDYLILLGAQQEHSRLFRTTNDNYNIYLDLGYDYYGSKGFTDMFLRRVSDQKVFLQHGIYSVMFTSGITLRTNREDDNIQSLDYGILKKRSWLVFHWIERVIQIL